MSKANEDDGELISGINVTPLVDIVLVLLVVLMVTAGYMVSRAIPVELPSAATGEARQSTITVTLTASGETHVNAERVSEPELSRKIRQARATGATKALIAADGAVPHRRVVRVVDALRREGIRELGFNVQPEDLASGAP